jgi:hypothetical protein
MRQPSMQLSSPWEGQITSFFKVQPDPLRALPARGRQRRRVDAAPHNEDVDATADAPLEASDDVSSATRASG